MDSSHGTSGSTGTCGGLLGTGTCAPGVGGPGAGCSTGVDQEAVSGMRRPKWLSDTLTDAERVTPRRIAVRESMPPEKFCSYIALVIGIIDSEPSNFDEASKQ